MEKEETLSITKKLRVLLRQAMLMLPSYQEGARKDDFEGIWNEVCKIVLQDDLCQNIWAEDLLLQIDKLFKIIPPNAKRWGDHLNSLNGRKNEVRKTIGFFIILSINEILFIWI